MPTAMIFVALRGRHQPQRDRKCSAGRHRRGAHVLLGPVLAQAGIAAQG
jgi:hypothetical protein